MRMTRIGRVSGSGRWRTLTVSAAALAAVGVLGAVPPAVASASPQQALDWTSLAPAAHPSPRTLTEMAYDAATGTVVLFGGYSNTGNLGDTWTWNGTTWTKQHPATSPPARNDAAMAYDAATGTVVLFGGYSNTGNLGDTWTWNGTTWTKQHPATSPGRSSGIRMAYDAATGTVVLFDGATWTWDGTTWTKQAVANPRARIDAMMAYDAATGTVVLFGGASTTSDSDLNDTWTWDGTTWTKQAPAVHPGPRDSASMAYDAATGTVVLFGGYDPTNECVFDGTWTWDGTTWTKQAPAVHPTPRVFTAMAYDAATGTVVLFGGTVDTTTTARCPPSGEKFVAQTWTWG
jgi:hypothetical protein